MSSSVAWKSSERSFASSTTRNGPYVGAGGRPNTSVKNVADRSRSRHHTIVWFSRTLMTTGSRSRDDRRRRVHVGVPVDAHQRDALLLPGTAARARERLERHRNGPIGTDRDRLGRLARVIQAEEHNDRGLAGVLRAVADRERELGDAVAVGVGAEHLARAVVEDLLPAGGG